MAATNSAVILKSPTPRAKNKKKDLPYHHDYLKQVKLKPFHCKFPGCTRRFKRYKTLALHQDTHGTGESDRHREEIEQGIADKEHVFDYAPSTNKDGSDAFLDAKYGRKEIMLNALRKGYYKSGSKHKKTGETPLIVASQWGEIAIVELLLIRKANPNLVDGHGNTALA